MENKNTENMAENKTLTEKSNIEKQGENLTLLEIEKILQKYKGQPDLKIALNTKFEELELDSLDTVDLVMEIEDAMKVTIEMSKEIVTIGHLVEIIEKQKTDKK